MKATNAIVREIGINSFIISHFKGGKEKFGSPSGIFPTIATEG
jgi:hypothetical protein